MPILYTVKDAAGATVPTQDGAPLASFDKAKELARCQPKATVISSSPVLRSVVVYEWDAASGRERQHVSVGGCHTSEHFTQDGGGGSGPPPRPQ